MFMDTSLTDLFINIIGTLGVLLIVLAYLLLQTGKIGQFDLTYPVLNLVGALMVMVSILRFWNLPSFIIEAFWIAISVWGLYRCLKTPRP